MFYNSLLFAAMWDVAVKVAETLPRSHCLSRDAKGRAMATKDRSLAANIDWQPMQSTVS